MVFRESLSVRLLRLCLLICLMCACRCFQCTEIWIYLLCLSLSTVLNLQSLGFIMSTWGENRQSGRLAGKINECQKQQIFHQIEPRQASTLRCSQFPHQIRVCSRITERWPILLISILSFFYTSGYHWPILKSEIVLFPQRFFLTSSYGCYNEKYSDYFYWAFGPTLKYRFAQLAFCPKKKKQSRLHYNLLISLPISKTCTHTHIHRCMPFKESSLQTCFNLL